MKKLLSIASFVILAFGFLYISWQLGRAYASNAEAPQVIVIADTEECAVHQALIFELVEPSDKYEIHTKFKEYDNQ